MKDELAAIRRPVAFARAAALDREAPDARQKAGIDLCVVSNTIHYLKEKTSEECLAFLRRWNEYGAEIQEKYKNRIVVFTSTLPCGGLPFVRELERAVLRRHALLLERYPTLLTARYGFPVEGLDGPALVEVIARRRGCRMKGGALDLEKAAQILLTDYRSGALGRISLETPESREAMLAGEAAGRRV